MSQGAELDNLVLEAMELGATNLAQIEHRVRQTAEIHAEAHGVAPEWWPAGLPQQWLALVDSCKRQIRAGRVALLPFDHPTLKGKKINKLQLTEGVVS